MPHPLPNIRACVFDAYGTLFDFASAAKRCADIPPDKMGPLTALWRDKQIQYTWLRTMQNRHVDFWQVTGDALDFALETLGMSDPKLRETLMQLYLHLDCFPEVPDVLRRLKSAGMRTAILSNGSPTMLDAAVKHAGLTDLLDDVLSVEEVGAFKTDPKVYQLAIDRLGLAAIRHLVSVFQCLGRLGGVRLRHARRLVQPLRPAPGAPAGQAGCGDRDLGGFAGIGDQHRSCCPGRLSEAKETRDP